MSDQAVPLIGFRLDPTSGTPTYLQIVQQVEQALRLGYLQRDDQLPRVREVVEECAVNPNTVLKAYRELEHRGLAVGRPGLGTFIVGTLAKVGLREQATLRRGLLHWMRTAEAAGLDEPGMVALFNSALGDLNGEPVSASSKRDAVPVVRSHTDTGDTRPGAVA